MYQETHHTDIPHRLVSDVRARQKKSILTCWNGYHSLELAESARDATCFITEWGRYCYLCALQGFHASGDGYTKRCKNSIIRVKRSWNLLLILLLMYTWQYQNLFEST